METLYTPDASLGVEGVRKTASGNVMNKVAPAHPDESLSKVIGNSEHVAIEMDVLGAAEVELPEGYS